VKVEKVRRNWAIEQGDVAVVVDDGKEKGMLVGPNEEEDWEDAKPNSEQQGTKPKATTTCPRRHHRSSFTTDNMMITSKFRSTP